MKALLFALLITAPAEAQWINCANFQPPVNSSAIDGANY